MTTSAVMQSVTRSVMQGVMGEGLGGVLPATDWHWDANDQASMFIEEDATGGTPTDGQQVGYWEGTIQITPGARPLWRETGGPNGLACVEFDGTDDYLAENTMVNTFSTTNLSFYMVCELATWVAGGPGIFGLRTSSAAQWQTLDGLNAGMHNVAGNILASRSAPNLSMNTPDARGDFVLVECHIAGDGTAELYLDGQLEDTDTGVDTTSIGPTILVMGVSGLDGPFPTGIGPWGHICIGEVVLYDTVHSPAVQAQVRDFLMVKWLPNSQYFFGGV